MISITAGSHFWQSGTFEVTKSEGDPNDPDPSDPMHNGLRPESSSLQVTVPSELEGIAYIQVAIRKLNGRNGYDNMVNVV